MRELGRFVSSGVSLVPRDRSGREIVARIKPGDSVLMEAWNPRNMRQHRKYFAVLNNVVEASGKWASTEHLRRDILISLGRYDEHVNQFTGEVSKVPHSMSVGSMPKDEFERLYTDTMRLLTDALGCDPEFLVEEAA